MAKKLGGERKLTDAQFKRNVQKIHRDVVNENLIRTRAAAAVGAGAADERLVVYLTPEQREMLLRVAFYAHRYEHERYTLQQLQALDNATEALRLAQPPQTVVR